MLGLVLRDVAAGADSYATGRTALFDELGANVAALGAAAPKIRPGEVADGAGVVYRYFPEHGYQFHPLASFATLDSLALRGRGKEAERLAQALVARGVKSGKALLWHYRFPFGGPEIWTSGFAQAVAAQALARTGELAGDAGLAQTAAAAFRAIPRDLTRPSPAATRSRGTASDMAVLNAQLQSMVSLLGYVELTGNEDARTYVAGLDDSTRSALGQFDTGCWSLYSLDGNPATTHYHSYHVELLERLGRVTGERLYRETGRRWRGYLEAGGC